jgi:hypothetical protein
MNLLLIAVLWTKMHKDGWFPTLGTSLSDDDHKTRRHRRARSDRKRTCARRRELRSLVHAVAVRTSGWSRQNGRRIVPRDCPSSGGEAQGCALRSPQQIVCRRRTGSPAAIAAHKCFATLALVLPFARRRLYYCRVGRRRGLVGPRRGGAIVPRAARVRGGMTAAASLLA